MYHTIKDRLQNEKRDSRKLSGSLQKANFTEAERQKVEHALNVEQEAEKAEQINAILAVTGELADLKTRQGERRLLGNLAESSSLSNSERDAMVGKLLEQQKLAQEQQAARKEYADAHLHAKLEARRRLREEKAKEDALRKEMDTLSENRVSLFRLFISLIIFFKSLL